MVGNFEPVGAAELRALAARLQAMPPQDDVVLTLTTNSAPAERGRGILTALRSALETAVEPPSNNLRNAWGDWPHDLFAAVAEHVEAVEGIGIALFAWPGGRWEAFTAGVSTQPLGYTLVQPVTFPLVAAAQQLDPVLSIELHRTHAALREQRGTTISAEERIEGMPTALTPKTGSLGMLHAERHAHEVEERYLRTVAARAAERSRAARAVIVVGDHQLGGALGHRLHVTVPLGFLDANPDRSVQESAIEVAEAATAAIATSQWAQIEAILASKTGVDDWTTALAAARDGRLMEAWVAPLADLHNYECLHCGAHVQGGDACVRCGASVWERLPLAESLLRHASATGAAIHFTIGDAARALEERGGVAARLRY